VINSFHLLVLFIDVNNFWIEQVLITVVGHHHEFETGLSSSHNLPKSFYSYSKLYLHEKQHGVNSSVAGHDTKDHTTTTIFFVLLYYF
jgi:hypothetical protein